jgi:hypothetical protein
MSTLLITAGQFICLTVKDAFISHLPQDAVSRYWDGMRIAEGTRQAEANVAYVNAQTFGRDVLRAFPAPSAEACQWYAEHYEGMHQEMVRGLMACVLTGTAYGVDEDKLNQWRGDGGTPDRVHIKPKLPIKPGPGDAYLKVRPVSHDSP